MDTVFAEQPTKVKKGKQGKRTRMKTTPF